MSAALNGGQAGSKVAWPPSTVKLGSHRKSTPDSDALVSSEDDEQAQPKHAANSQAQRKGYRRPSWLSEVRTDGSRRVSGASGGSNPPTPSSEQSSWLPATAGPRPSTSGGHFPWSSQIWAQEGRRDPPARLTELTRSPIARRTGSRGAMFDEEQALASPISQDAGGDNSFPFAIPLHPTPKTYRSMSYSVGQMDGDQPSLSQGGSENSFAGRTRTAVQLPPGLSGRVNRPALGAEDVMNLPQLQEFEDEEEPPNQNNILMGGNTFGNRMSDSHHADALRQQAMERANARKRPGTSSSNLSSNGSQSMQGSRDFGSGSIEDLEYLQRAHSEDLAGYEPALSHSNTMPGFQSDGRKFDSLKRGQWQSSLGFGGLPELPQSRRHSMADIQVPVRNPSLPLGNVNAELSAYRAHQAALGSPGDHNAYVSVDAMSQFTPYLEREHETRKILSEEQLRDRGFAANYFTRKGDVDDLLARMGRPSNETLHSPTGGTFAIPPAYSTAGLMDSLYIVSFKCSRADVFYIQEGTGLDVNPGDLVIVEADRGTDLGTVLYAKITWQKARDLKDKLAEEHYRWLMCYSKAHQSARAGAVNPNEDRNTPHGAHGHLSGDGPFGGLRPKMIKRLAQPHEIKMLQEKEGNEAKAKRVCQQKVNEHHLHMEILDAEFQMDWKKLTFYYFAETYINFNALVQDLFKIWKTRIWMSAVNPASFASAQGIQPPSAIGPGALPNPRENVYGTSNVPPSDREQDPARMTQLIQEYPGRFIPVTYHQGQMYVDRMQMAQSGMYAPIPMGGPAKSPNTAFPPGALPGFSGPAPVMHQVNKTPSQQSLSGGFGPPLSPSHPSFSPFAHDFVPGMRGSSGGPSMDAMQHRMGNLNLGSQAPIGSSRPNERPAMAVNQNPSHAGSGSRSISGNSSTSNVTLRASSKQNGHASPTAHG